MKAITAIMRCVKVWRRRNDSITQKPGQAEKHEERASLQKATWKKPAQEAEIYLSRQKDYDTIEREMADLEDLVCRLDEGVLTATDFCPF